MSFLQATEIWKGTKKVNLAQWIERPPVVREGMGSTRGITLCPTLVPCWSVHFWQQLSAALACRGNPTSTIGPHNCWVVCLTVMILISFSTVQIYLYGLSYIHLHFSPSSGILQTHELPVGLIGPLVGHCNWSWVGIPFRLELIHRLYLSHSCLRVVWITAPTSQSLVPFFVGSTRQITRTFADAKPPVDLID